jgi:hypothetical protein
MTKSIRKLKDRHKINLLKDLNPEEIIGQYEATCKSKIKVKQIERVIPKEEEEEGKEEAEVENEEAKKDEDQKDEEQAGENAEQKEGADKEGEAQNEEDNENKKQD